MSRAERLSLFVLVVKFVRSAVLAVHSNNLLTGEI